VRDGDVTHAEVVQFVFDLGFAVAAVSGRSARGAAGAALYPLDRRGQLRRVGRVPDLDVVVEDDAVFVVDDLCLVTELDRSPEASFADRPGVRIVQADQPRAAVRHHTGEAAAGLRHDASGTLDDRDQVIEGTAQLAFALTGRAAAGPLAVAQHGGGFAHRGLGQVGQLAGDALHRGLPSSFCCAPRSLSFPAIARARRPAARRRSRERVCVAPPAAWIRLTVRAICPAALASSPESVG